MTSPPPGQIGIDASATIGTWVAVHVSVGLGWGVLEGVVVRVGLLNSVALASGVGVTVIDGIAVDDVVIVGNIRIDVMGDSSTVPFMVLLPRAVQPVIHGMNAQRRTSLARFFIFISSTDSRIHRQ